MIKENSNSENDSNIKENKKKLTTKFIVFFSIMICFIFSMQIGNELNCLTYLPSYLTKSSLALNPKQAAYIVTILSFTKAIGRLITSFLILKANIVLMIYFNLSVVLIGNILLVTLGIKILAMTWVSLGLIGLGLSSTSPLLFCFVEKNISLRSKYSAAFTLAICLYISSSSMLIGNFLESDPNNFIYFNIFTITLMTLVFSILLISKKLKLFS